MDSTNLQYKVIQFFSTSENKCHDSESFQKSLLDITNRTDLSEKEKLDVIFSKLNEDERKIFEAMLNDGKTIEEIIKVLANNKATFCPAAGPINVSEILNNSTLTIEEKFQLLKGNMKSSELDQIENLINAGMSIEEALKTVADVDQDDQTSDFAKRIKQIIKKKSLNQEQILSIIK